MTPPYRLWIPGPLPGENEIIAAAKGFGGRGYGYAKIKKQWTAAAQSAAAGVPPLTRARFTFIWHEVAKRRNPDNIAAGVKFVYDGLVAAGVLPNDGWNEIASWSNEFVVDKGSPGVEVVIDPIGQAALAGGADRR